MGVIRILHEKVVSQIAAGEVIERPASVVRELLDNSIDAGAARIQIVVESGGRKRITSSDDGVGMGRDDLLLSVERHATSKITELRDLYSVRSLGFRGEALPSIASVSRMEITSRTQDQLIGHRLKVAGGRLRSIEETGCPAGTRVDVRDLFFNTPVRRKFLKGDKTETDHILDVITRIGLPHLRIHFRLDEGERTLLNLPTSQDELSRLSAVFGRTVVSSMLESSHEEGEFRFRTYLGHPDFPRARGDRLLFYVNARHIRDRLLVHAVMEGYGQRLMKGRYPQAVVFIEVEPSLVDVNIHPAKQEIRFQQAHRIHQSLTEAVRRTLARLSFPDFRSSEAREWTGTVTEDGPAVGVSEPLPDGYGEGRERLFKEPIATQEPLLREPDLQVLGQLRNTYILCEGSDGLLLIDQHAAHERVLYESLKGAYQASRMETQAFLIPQKLEFSLREAEVLGRSLEPLRKLGLEMEPFGGTAFLLRTVPQTLIHVPMEKMVSELTPALEEGRAVSPEGVLDELLSVMACHGAVRAGQRLSREEMNLLVKQLLGAGLPAHCPHGRPTVREFRYNELDRMFKRVV